MGLISKIEDKLSGSSKHDNENQTTHSSATNTSSTQSGAASSLQHPIQSTTTHGGHGNVPGATGSALGAGASGAGLTGSNHGSNHGAGLTGSNHGTGLTGSNHGAGLTGSNHGAGLAGSNHGAGLTGSNLGDGLIGSNHGVGAAGSNHGTGVTGYGRDGSNVSSTSDHLKNTHLTGNHPSSNLSSSTDAYGQPGSNISSSTGVHGQHGGIFSSKDNSTTGHNSSTSDHLFSGPGKHDSITGTTSSTGHNVPREPYTPYSSKGQQIAAAAGVGSHSGDDKNMLTHGRSETQDHGSRSESGGVLSDQGLRSGPHPSLENHAAIPTAGGYKVGSGAPSSTYDNSTSNTTGIGAHETGKHHGGLLGHLGKHDTTSGHGASSQNTSNTLPTGSDSYDQQLGSTGQGYGQSGTTSNTHDFGGAQKHGNQHQGTRAGVLGAAAGALGSGHGHQQDNHGLTSNTHNTGSGLTGNTHSPGSGLTGGTHNTGSGLGSEYGSITGSHLPGQHGQGVNSSAQYSGSGLGGGYGDNTGSHLPGQHGHGLTGHSNNTSISTETSSGGQVSAAAAAKKAAATYEAGYRDALDHAKSGN